MSEKPINNSSLKGKALNLETLVTHIHTTLLQHMKEVAQMESQNNEGSSFNVIQVKAKQIRTNIMREIQRIQTIIKEHFTWQKLEKIRLVEEIKNIKNQKNYIRKSLSVLQSRISQIEIRLGTDTGSY